MLGLGNSLVTGGASEEWTPSQLGSTLELWYQYNTGQTNLSGTDGNSDNRMQWDDQSGNSRHAQQDTDAKKPSITSGYLDFDDASTQDYLTLATGDGALEFGDDDPFTVVVGISQDSLSSGSDRFIGGDGSEFIGLTPSGDRLQVRGGGALCVPIFDDGVVFPAATDHVITITRDASMFIRVYKNGNLLTLDSSTNNYDASNPTKLIMGDGAEMTVKRIGAGVNVSNENTFDGKLYELMICNTVLSDTDRNLATNYVKNKLGI